MSMTTQQAAQALRDTTFLLGAFRRRGALKFLAQCADAEAAQVLVEAVDDKAPCADRIPAVLAAAIFPAWNERLWSLWAAKRQPWLGDLLIRKGQLHAATDARLHLLSLLKLGQVAALAVDPKMAAAVAAWWADKDTQVRQACRAYFERVRQADGRLWMGSMLGLREFETIGKTREGVMAVLAFLNAGPDAALRKAGRTYLDEWLPFELHVFALLAEGKAATLPTDDEKVARQVCAFVAEKEARVLKQAEAYLAQLAAQAPVFLPALAFKLGRPQMIQTNRATVAEALRLTGDPDATVQAGAKAWLRALPNDQALNDVIVDEWLRTDSAALLELLCEQRRLPSDGGKEALLLLLAGDVAGYQAMRDADGHLLAEALTMAGPQRRDRVVQALNDSHSADLADQLNRASMRVQGFDKGLGLKALLAAGDEDRIVAATRDLRGGELFELCQRWAETGRRPAAVKARAAVEQAVVALKGQPAFKVEPAPPLPAGLRDLLEVWAEAKPAAADAPAEDPFVGAQALFVAASRGSADQAALRAKAGSAEWPERFAAGLQATEVKLDGDPVHWVAACAGADDGLAAALVHCGPDEFGDGQKRLEALRRNRGAFARRQAARWEALQAFRALFGGSEIVVGADDGATQRGAAVVTEDAKW